jgi:hypothetical protein
MIGYNPFIGQKLKTNVAGKSVDASFVAHVKIENPEAADDDQVHGLITLTSATQSVTTAITNPDVPRNLNITGDHSGIAGNVVITGKNYRNETITETIALNGTATVAGTKAFKEVTSIALPIRSHTEAYQAESQTVTHKADSAGTLVVTVTASGMGSSPKAVDVAVALNDSINTVAGKIRTALGLDEDVAEWFTVSGADENIILTVKAYQDNDSSMSIALTSADSTGVTFGSSTNATAGVAQDKVKVGVGEILGLPYFLTHNTILKTYLNNVLEGTAPTVTMDSNEIEKNTIDLNSSLDGNDVDIYLIV